MKMSRRSLFMVSGGLLFVVALIVAWPRTPAPPVSQAAPEVRSAQRPVTQPLHPAGGDSGTRQAAPLAPSPTGKGPQRSAQEISEEIFNLSVHYTADNVPKIGVYLTHADKNVRTAAINGLINLGEKSAAPLIRKASEELQDPEEIVAYRKTADYLELPSDSERNK